MSHDFYCILESCLFFVVVTLNLMNNCLGAFPYWTFLYFAKNNTAWFEI